MGKRVIEIVYDEQSFEKAREFVVEIDPPRTLSERIELARFCAAFHYRMRSREESEKRALQHPTGNPLQGHNRRTPPASGPDTEGAA